MTEEPATPEKPIVVAKAARRSRPGCLARLFGMAGMICMVVLVAMVVMVITPQDLTDLRMRSAAQPGVRDVSESLRQAVTRQYEITLDEAVINRWLESVSGRLGDAGGGRLWVRLIGENRAELIWERPMLGKSLTFSVFLTFSERRENDSIIKTLDLQGGQYHPDLPIPLIGGRFGQLLVPQGFLLAVLPQFQEAARCFQDEIHHGFDEMNHIRIQPGKLVLDPRVELSNETLPLSD
jgi:hypothetical protein